MELEIRRARPSRVLLEWAQAPGPEVSTCSAQGWPPAGAAQGSGWWLANLPPGGERGEEIHQAEHGAARPDPEGRSSWWRGVEKFDPSPALQVSHNLRPNWWIRQGKINTGPIAETKPARSVLPDPTIKAERSTSSRKVKMRELSQELAAPRAWSEAGGVGGAAGGGSEGNCSARARQPVSLETKCGRRRRHRRCSICCRARQPCPRKRSINEWPTR